jgi:hypothetical protein
MYATLPLNSQSSCLSLLSTGIAGMNHYAQFGNILFLTVLGFELMVSHLLDRHSTLEPLPAVLFCVGYFLK